MTGLATPHVLQLVQLVEDQLPVPITAERFVIFSMQVVVPPVHVPLLLVPLCVEWNGG